MIPVASLALPSFEQEKAHQLSPILSIVSIREGPEGYKFKHVESQDVNPDEMDIVSQHLVDSL